MFLFEGSLACGDTTGGQTLEVESANPVEVWSRKIGQPVYVKSKSVTQQDLPHPVMGKIAAPVDLQSEFKSRRN